MAWPLFKTRERSRQSRAARTTYACSHEWCFSIKYYRETAQSSSLGQFLVWNKGAPLCSPGYLTVLNCQAWSGVWPARKKWLRIWKVCFTTRRGEIRGCSCQSCQKSRPIRFASISSDIKPSEKEASKLPQIMKKIAKADPQLAKTAGINLYCISYRLILLLFSIRLWSFLTYSFYFMFIKLLSAKDKLPCKFLVSIVGK